MRNERGVTPIISVVLLLMMTVAIAGLAWFWLQSLTQSTMNATDTMTKQQTNQMLTLIDIADYSVGCGANGNATNVTFQVFNRGSTTIDVNSVVIGGKNFAISPITSISPSTIGSVVVGTTANPINPNFISGLENDTSKSADILIASAQGYVKKTMTINGARCMQ